MKNITSLRDLHGRLLQYKSGIILILILQLLWAFIELLVPFLTQALVDQGIYQQDLHFIYLILLAQLMLFVGTTATDYFKLWLVRNVGVRLNMQLINNYLQQILKKPILFYNEHPYGVVLQNLNDNFRIERFLTISYVDLINAIFRLIIFGIVLFLYDFRAGLILLASVVVFFIWNFAFWHQRAKVDKLLFKTRSTIRNNLLQIVNGIYDVKLNSLESYRLEQWYGGQNMLSNTRLTQLKIWQYYQGGVSIINQLRDTFILLFTAMAVVKGVLTLGAMLAIQYILGRLNKPMTDIMQFIQDYQDAKLSMERLKTFTAADPQDYLPAPNIPTTKYELDLILKEVFFNYKETPAVNGVSFTIPYGTKVAIVGESGSGKSTLLKVLLKLLLPNKGLVKVGNRNLSDIDTANWRANCSTVAQEGFIFDETLIYNITLQREEHLIDWDLFHKALESACLDTLVDSLDKGIRTLLGKTGKTLSKGQGQRVLLARAFYKNANYLFLDEPTSALDTITAKQVLQNMQQIFADRTIVMVTHKVEIAASMDLVLLIDQGRVIEIGTHDDLVKQDGHYAALWKTGRG